MNPQQPLYSVASVFSLRYPPFTSSRSCQFILNPKHDECFSIRSSHSLVLATCQFERKEKASLASSTHLLFTCFVYSISFLRTLPVSKGTTRGFQVQKSLCIRLCAHKQASVPSPVINNTVLTRFS